MSDSSEGQRAIQELDIDEVADPDESEPLEVPEDRRRVYTDKQDVPVETLHGWITQGELDVQPEFQRNFVWSDSKASRLVESLILDIPIPVLYIAEEEDGSYSVVDGQQRLTSLSSFISGKFPSGRPFKLTGLQVLTELNGKHFKDLQGELAKHRRAITRSALRLIIIQKHSDPDVKFEVFERLNLGAERLNDQELRNCVFRGPYNELLKKLATNPQMLKVTNAKEPHARMADRQMILRFLAMWRKTHLHYKGPMKQFLNREMEEHRNASQRDLNEMQAVFEKTIDMAYVVFGRSAFRRFRAGTEGAPDGTWESSRINLALWDTVMFGLSFYEKSQVVPAADAIREELLDLMTNDSSFVEYITSTGDKPERIKYRAEEWQRRLGELLDARAQPRTFTLELKQRLFDSQPTCRICSQKIHDVDDSEVDHVKHYWRGGATVPDNARLTHRYCNRARGGRD